MDPDRLREAVEFATVAHGNQRRKHSGRPYIVHPMRVALLVAPHVSDDGVIAALLHDVVEDTEVELLDVSYRFGYRVADLVEALTKEDVKPRAARKARDRERLSAADWEAQTIKAADVMDNARSILGEPEFTKLWIDENHRLLNVLVKAHPTILKAAKAALADREMILLGEGQ